MSSTFIYGPVFFCGGQGCCTISVKNHFSCVILGGNPRLQSRQYYEDVFTGKEMDRSTD
jgi:hypothetical protein